MKTPKTVKTTTPVTAAPQIAQASAPTAATVIVQLGEQRLVASAKTFSTGSTGFYANGKLHIDPAATVQTVLIAGQAVAVTRKTFSTGSVGFNLNGKVEIGGMRYQVGGNLVQLGSGPDAKPETAAKGAAGWHQAGVNVIAIHSK